MNLFRLIAILLTTAPVLSFAQVEPDVHLDAIRGRTGADSAFLEYVLNNGLERKPDKRFISDRDLLTPLCVSLCSYDSLIIHDTLRGGRTVEVRLYTSLFDSAAHVYSYFPGTDSLISAIDGVEAFGAVDNFPTRKLDSLAVTLDGAPIRIPPDAYNTYYDVNLCGMELFQQPVMAYPSLDQEYLYLYLYGGQSLGTYFAKLVFDEEHFLTRIVTEYATLRQYGALRPDFVGY